MGEVFDQGVEGEAEEEEDEDDDNDDDDLLGDTPRSYPPLAHSTW